MAQPVKATASTRALPRTSAMGAKTSGPTAYPATKSATPRLMTSWEMAYSRAVTPVAAPKTLDANEIEKITANGAEDRRSLVRSGQFCGLSGSSGPFHSTSSKAVVSGGVETPFGVETPGRGFNRTSSTRLFTFAISVTNCMVTR